MQYHATRAMERAQRALSAESNAEAWSDMFEALAAFGDSLKAGEPERDQSFALNAMLATCKHHFRLAAGSDAKTMAESKEDGWRLTQKPDTAWLDAAAHHDFNES